MLSLLIPLFVRLLKCSVSIWRQVVFSRNDMRWHWQAAVTMPCPVSRLSRCQPSSCWHNITVLSTHCFSVEHFIYQGRHGKSTVNNSMVCTWLFPPVLYKITCWTLLDTSQRFLPGLRAGEMGKLCVLHTLSMELKDTRCFPAHGA